MYHLERERRSRERLRERERLRLRLQVRASPTTLLRGAALGPHTRPERASDIMPSSRHQHQGPPLIRSLEVDRNVAKLPALSTASSAVEVVPHSRTATRQLEDDALAGQVLAVEVVDGVIGVARRIELLQFAMCQTEGKGTEMRWRMGTPATSVGERNVIVLHGGLHDGRREHLKKQHRMNHNTAM
ncbi:hypothetical protein PRIPAC_76387 [Pristionchus pacificus]|uniref:Uncharacterized protein n=1 Tax=Pristionchus pacificus TaxID=54126 RepID=A0A2A6C850_PRIPA|nr:hypothetical protein PRIPAC_76387 [Pristionchus pacificus]|eukprot:PDM74201.1 hypothetical protein PRIPAC_41557 [Pristionchus pacificus]